MTKVTGDWLTQRGTQSVLTMLEEAGHQAYAVGGCVRNAVLGEPVGDVDISTSARPEQVIDLAKAAGLKPVPTGIDHGTITVVVDGEGYEVTSFRADVETDGRRAVVRFSDDIHEDAIRRDFTMNALYADRHGTIIDPLGGLPDLLKRHLRFIEDAEQRIREDYLRVLRYFRFFAWYADPNDGMDPEALAAIANTLDGLNTLSRERVGSEFLKLLSAADPLMSISVMAQTGVLTHLLPGSQIRAFGPLLHHEEALALQVNPIRRLLALGHIDGSSLRLSKGQQREIALLQRLISGTENPAEIAHLHGASTARDVVVLRAALLEIPLIVADEAELKHAEDAKFPVQAQDLMPEFSGPALGAVLKRLQRRWIASNFAMSKTDLLDSRYEP